MNEPTAVTELVCKLCGHTWVPRVSHPKVCPHCKSYNWDKSPWEVENEVSGKAKSVTN